MKEKCCQSCGMPMDNAEVYGTNADGSQNADYCKYCYENGVFAQNCTMDEMIDLCAPYMPANCGMSENDARSMMKELFPTLKRWKQD
jgi:hypothetical protein